MRAISIAKLGEDLVNEDAVIARNGLIAVSDGAGGGGVFADLWSKYLLEHLPDKPIRSFKSFDQWIDGIWEPFYNDCEQKAQREGGMLLNKFYDEGSFATLVAVWKGGQWICYGDSVAFCYNRETDILQHSFSKLADFEEPPYLINCKDPLNSDGFRQGRFEINENCIVFAASDALAHYILMMYELTHRDQYADELRKAINGLTKNSKYIETAMRIRKKDFAKDVIQKLENCKSTQQFGAHVGRLKRWGLIGHDDYSLAIL